MNHPLTANNSERCAHTTHGENEIRFPDQSTNNSLMLSGHLTSLFSYGLTANAVSKRCSVPRDSTHTIPTNTRLIRCDGAMQSCPTAPPAVSQAITGNSSRSSGNNASCFAFDFSSQSVSTVRIHLARWLSLSSHK